MFLSQKYALVQGRKGTHMRFISKEYLLYYLQTTFVGVFVLVLLAYNVDATEKTYLNNGMYSNNVYGVQIENPKEMQGIEQNTKLDVMNIPVSKDFMIYKSLIEGGDEIVRAIYGTDDVFKLASYLKEGRFFNTDDYKNNTLTAVIGSDVLPETWTENGKRYYGYNKQKYEVIGIFKETGSNLDFATYLNLCRVLQDESNYGTYYVDADSEDVVMDVIDSLTKKQTEDYKAEKIPYSSTMSYGMSPMENTLFIFAVLAGGFHMILTSIFLITRQQYTVAIHKLCGMTYKDILLKYGKRMTVIFVLSFASIVLCINLMKTFWGNFFALEKLMTVHYAIMAGIMLMISVLIVICIANLTKRVDISAVLKGR